MTDVVPNVQTLTEEAMGIFRNNTDELFDEDDVKNIIRTAISKELKQAEEFKSLEDRPTYHQVEMAVRKFLTTGEIQHIMNGFDIETFTMNVEASRAVIRRNGEEFMATIILNSGDRTWSALLIQIASFLVEIVFFVLGCIGIHVHFENREMHMLIGEVDQILQRTPIQQYIREFLSHWNRGTFYNKAKAIFVFLVRTNALGILYTVFKLSIENMSIWGKIKAMAEIVGMFVAAFATGGVALIAKFALAIDGAVSIVQKIYNVTRLETMHTNYRE